MYLSFLLDTLYPMRPRQGIEEIRTDSRKASRCGILFPCFPMLVFVHVVFRAAAAVHRRRH